VSLADINTRRPRAWPPPIRFPPSFLTPTATMIATLETLAKINAHVQCETTRIAAAHSIFDRGWGRPGIQEEPKPQPAEQSMV
jgi:hypothetical protein